MDGSTFDALVALQNASNHWTPAVSKSILLVTAGTMLFGVCGIVGTLVTHALKRRKALPDESWPSFAVPVAMFAVLTFPTTVAVLTLHDAYVQAAARAGASYDAVVQPACRTVLDSISQGGVSVVTKGVVETIQTRCGEIAFMAAANAPGSRVDFAASAHASTLQPDL